MARDYARLSRYTGRLMWGSYGVLLVAFTLNTVVMPSCDRQPNVVVWLLHCLPVLAFLPALLKGHLRASAWFCFILLFYFLLAMPVAMACVNPITTLEVFAIVVLFVSTMMYIRWQSLSNKQQSAIGNDAQESTTHG